MCEQEDEEKQEYIEKYCGTCKKNRIFVTTLSPKDSLICTVCRHREPIVPFKFVQSKFGYKMVKEK